MAITDWPENERPRERLLAQGAAALTDAELLAIFLRVGMKGKSGADHNGLPLKNAVRDYLRLHLAGLAHEVFLALWLDAQNCLIAAEELFHGTLTQTSVYPREVVKKALWHNAAAVVLAHNHPSGVAEPSNADQLLTRELKQALALVDVRVLDHFIVAGQNQPLSFAERGLL